MISQITHLMHPRLVYSSFTALLTEHVSFHVLTWGILSLWRIANFITMRARYLWDLEDYEEKYLKRVTKEKREENLWTLSLSYQCRFLWTLHLDTYLFMICNNERRLQHPQRQLTLAGWLVSLTHGNSRLDWLVCGSNPSCSGLTFIIDGLVLIRYLFRHDW